MPQSPELSHVAVLIPSVQSAAKVLSAFDFEIGPTEDWDAEGTREIYTGPKNSSGRLLLMEPVKPGAYSRALAKRGPGLHHVALDVKNIENFVAGIAGSGWLLHPRSLSTFQNARTVYLARPGIPMLIEVHQRETPVQRPRFVTGLEMPLTQDAEKTIASLGLGVFFRRNNSELNIRVGPICIAFGDLLPPNAESAEPR